MKKAIYTFGLVLATLISYGQSKDIYMSPTADKLVTLSSSGVMVTFQNAEYDYVEDIESVVLGSVPTAIKVLQKALDGLSDSGDNINDYGSFYTADFGYSDVILNRNSGNEYTILTKSEIKLILSKLKS